MPKRILFLALFILLNSTVDRGQTAFEGLTPGESTRAHVERVLGQPTSQVSERLFEYEKGGQQIYVQYGKSSAAAVRIEVVYSTSRERSQVISQEKLPTAADTRHTNKQGALEEYFGYPKYIVLTYELNSQTQVNQVGYYSRAVFESVAPELKNAPATGRWVGSWRNTLGKAGSSTISIVEQGGQLITGDEDGWIIEGGRRSGNVLTWEYRNQNNGCRDYKVRLEISSNGRTASGTYEVTDSCERQSYSGTYISYVKQ